MNAFPNDNSVLILDNCAIHKSAFLREVVEAHGIYYVNCLCSLSDRVPGSILLFLPPYSPDFNPIEESFSAGEDYDLLLCHPLTLYLPQSKPGFAVIGDGCRIAKPLSWICTRHVER